MRIEGASVRVVCLTVVADPLIGAGPISKMSSSFPIAGMRCIAGCTIGLSISIRRYAPYCSLNALNAPMALSEWRNPTEVARRGCRTPFR